MVRKPAQLPPRSPLTDQQIETARYVGSPEHKAERWWGGLPGAFVNSEGFATRQGKQDTTICNLITEADRNKATEWVRCALRNGNFRYFEGDKDTRRRFGIEKSIPARIGLDAASIPWAASTRGGR